MNAAVIQHSIMLLIGIMICWQIATFIYTD